MDENYCALIYSILRNVVPEVAFAKFGLTEKFTATGKPKFPKITFDAIRDMFKMKMQGYTYRQIGEMYGKTSAATYKIMKRSRYWASKEFDFKAIMKNKAF